MQMGLRTRWASETPGVSCRESKQGRRLGNRKSKMAKDKERKSLRRPGGEAGCNKSKSDKRIERKGCQQTEDLSLHRKIDRASWKIREPLREVMSPLFLEVCKWGCMNP